MYNAALRSKHLSPSLLSRFRASLLSYFAPHRVVILRLLLLIGVLFIAPVIGILTAEVGPLLGLIVVMIPLALIGLQIILPRLEWGPHLILIAAAFIPLSLSTGTESRLVDSLVLTLFFMGHWILKMLTVDKRFSLRPSPVNRPLLAFIVIVLVALVWSILLRDPLVIIWPSFPLVQLASAVVMIVLPGVFLLVANNISSIKLLKVMVGIMLLAGFLGLIKRYWLDSLPVNVEGLFTMWVISLSTALALFTNELSWLKRFVLLALAGGFVYWGFGMNISWVAGWLPGLIALGVLSFLRSKKLLVMLVVVAVVLIALKPDYYLGTVVENENEESGYSRLAAWQVNWRVTGKHLLFGTGPAGYAVYYMTYFPNEGMATHSNYIDVLAQIGIIGFVFYIWFFVVLAWEGYKLCLRLKGRGDFSEALACAALAGTISCIIAMGFGDWLFPFAYTQTIAGFDHAVYSWLFMGTILALKHIVDKESTESGLLART